MVGADLMAASTSCSVKWCAVQIGEILASGMRLEAGVYDVDVRNARNCVTGYRHGWRPLGGKDGFADNLFYPGRFKRVYCEANGIPFFLPSQLTDTDPQPEKWISAVTDCAVETLHLEAGTLILARSGSIGPVAFVSRTLAGKVFSDDVIRVSFKSHFDAGYVYAFLKSKVGQLLLCGSQYGAVITHIEPEHLASIPVPYAPEEVKRRIHEAIAKSYALRDESNDLLHKATDLLRDALKLPPIAEMRGLAAVPSADTTNGTDTTKRVPLLSFTVPAAELCGRLDASYHIPVVSRIAAHLRAHAAEVVTVGDKRVSKAVILPGRFKRVYVEEGHGRPMIGGKQLGELDPSGKKYLSASKHKGEFNELAIKENTILVTRSGTIGKVALTPRHWDSWIPSDHIMRIVPSFPDIAGYLYVWLSSEWAKPLIVRNTYGAVIDEISDSQLATVPVPFLADTALQEEINGLALRANALRSEAYDLEQSALRMVEEEIF